MGYSPWGPKEWTQLSDFTFTLLIHVSEEWSLVRGLLSSLMLH